MLQSGGIDKAAPLCQLSHPSQLYIRDAYPTLLLHCLSGPAQTGGLASIGLGWARGLGNPLSQPARVQGILYFQPRVRNDLMWSLMEQEDCWQRFYAIL